MNKISFIFFLLSFFLSLSIAQNQGVMQTISIPDGLSSPSVQSLYQDRFGYIWIMTEDGLNRYDGNKIKVYRNDPDDPGSLSGNNVLSAVEDHEGYLWIGGTGVFNRYDYATGTFKVFNMTSGPVSDRDRQVISLFTDSQGRVWAGTFGGTIHRLNRETGTFDVIAHVGTDESNYTGQIWNITQLRNGKILFANTNRGIFQYDESLGKLTNYLLDKDYSPKIIYRIQEDDDGTIWFSGANKVVHYNPNFYSYEILDALQIKPNIYHIGYQKIDDENYLFVSEPLGIIRYNPKTSKVTEIIESQLDPPFWFITDKYGILWLGARGGVNKYDPNAMPFEHVQLSTSIDQENRSNTLYSVILDNSDKQKVWAVAQGNKLINYNLNTGSIDETILKIPAPFQKNEIHELIQTKTGEFYLSLRNAPGLLKYNPSVKKVTLMNHLAKVFDSNFLIQDFSIDQNDNLFIGSSEGLLYIDLDNQKDVLIPTTMNRQYGQDFNNAVQKTIERAKDLAIIKKADESKKYSVDFDLQKNASVLIRCMGEGILDRTEQQVFDYGTLSFAGGKVIYSMQNIYNTFHAGGGQKNRTEYKLLKLTPGKYNLKYEMDSGHSYNHFNVPMPADSEFYGIQVYQISDQDYDILQNKLEKKLNDSSCIPIGVARDVLVSKKFANSVYISSQTQGLIRYNILTHSFIQYTFGILDKNNQKNHIVHCYEDISGNLWVSTLQGLVFLNPDNGNWRVFTEKDGLPSNTILRTIEDNNSDLWIISLGGLSKFNKSAPSDKWNFVNYDTRDGLAGYSFNGDPVKTPEGEILFIVGDDLHRFTPRLSNHVKPDILINDLKISDVSVFDPASPIKLKKSLMELGTLELPYNLNDLSFFFNVAHYSRPYKNRVFYKLEGFNTKWIEPELGSATFTNLEPGSYEFKVRGISADGIRNDEGASIKIEIASPWYQTTFAYIIYFFILAGLIFAVDRIQRQRVRAKERAAAAIKEAELRAQLAEAENERKTKELEEARQLQLSMLPKELPRLPHLDIAVYMQTATEVGGDYYDFHVGLDGTLTVVIGDATGHGMKAGTMVTTAKSLFNSYAPNPDILYSFHEITRCIKQMNFGKLSMCMTMLKIKGNKMQISTAGMPPSFIFRRDTRVIEEHLFKAMPLGTMDKFPYELKDTTLKPGDTILLMSDGLPELENNKGEMYGYKKIRNGFEDVAEKSPEEIVTYLKNEGAGWVNNADPDDDVTFVVIKVK